MKKLYFGLFIVIFILSAFPARAQVFGHPGATWVFTNFTPSWTYGFIIDEKWEYIQDTIILGTPAKDILSINKLKWPPPYAPNLLTTISHKYFSVTGDTVKLFAISDSTWIDLFDFSLQVGDTTHSPLKLRRAFGSTCDTAVIYNFPAIVSATGTDTIDGQSLRYYTVKFRIGQWPINDLTDTIYEYKTYWERMIGNYWYPSDGYGCDSVEAGGPLTFTCYKDDGMMTDSLCAYLAAVVESIGIEENSLTLNVTIYPNPVQDILTIQNPQTENYQILSYDGKLVGTYAGNSINVSQLSSGVYFMTNENRTWFKKFIKD